MSVQSQDAGEGSGSGTSSTFFQVHCDPEASSPVAACSRASTPASETPSMFSTPSPASSSCSDMSFENDDEAPPAVQSYVWTFDESDFSICGYRTKGTSAVTDTFPGSPLQKLFPMIKRRRPRVFGCPRCRFHRRPRVRFWRNIATLQLWSIDQLLATITRDAMGPWYKAVQKDLQRQQVEIEKGRAETERLRAEVEKLKLETKKCQAEVEEISPELARVEVLLIILVAVATFHVFFQEDIVLNWKFWE
ncbi:hypothetical protein QBC40DRAFT_292268 [Triangularia verruculosa]|uniref:Uncharacterized protein n=1 Tax=Triangularia verruculosa TaxID=2587418 RepID=A0AAN7B094_9PEZI|nr:hypothetical protein QBC40DRAFT_292268 [Triangularia verruculosa]